MPWVVVVFPGVWFGLAQAATLAAILPRDGRGNPRLPIHLRSAGASHRHP